jgi:hypothetical protein
MMGSYIDRGTKGAMSSFQLLQRGDPGAFVVTQSPWWSVCLHAVASDPLRWAGLHPWGASLACSQQVSAAARQNDEKAQGQHESRHGPQDFLHSHNERVGKQLWVAASTSSRPLGADTVKTSDWQVATEEHTFQDMPDGHHGSHCGTYRMIVLLSTNKNRYNYAPPVMKPRALPYTGLWQLNRV